MLAEIIVTAKYNKCPNSLFKIATNFTDVIEATRKISTYSGLPAVQMEVGRTYTTDIKVFGVFQSRGYKITINKLCPDIRLMESYEYGDSINLWWHRLKINSIKTGSIWVDHVVIDAGFKTSIMSHYAKFMYQHRHKFRGGTDIQACLRKNVKVS